MRAWLLTIVAMGLVAAGLSWGEDKPGGAAPATSQATTTQSTTSPTTQNSGERKLRGVTIDTEHKRIRVECQELTPGMPLEFFCVERGGPEHEAVLKTDVQPSTIHFMLLALGLVPGEPAHFDQKTNDWFSPTGAGLKITCEFQVNGKTVTVPANRMMRSVKTHEEMPEMAWVFDGSAMLPDGQYAADIAGYVVSIVNFDMTMIDVPELASNANETLEWEYNPDVCPPKGAAVTMIIEPADQAVTRPAETKPGGSYNPGPGSGGGAR